MGRAKVSGRQQKLVRQRVQLVLQVQAGHLSVQQAAQQLRVTRQTFHKWQRRALRALLSALRNRPRGRPAMPHDPQREKLHRQNQEWQQQVHVLQQTLRIRELLNTAYKKRPRRPAR